MFGLESDNMRTIGDIANICRGASPRPISKYVTDSEDGVNWIKIGDVTEDDIYITHTAEKITKEGAKKSRTVEPGDFILSNSMSFGRPYLVDINGCVHDGWLIISDYQRHLNPLFFYYELRSDVVQRQFDGSANGSCVKNLNSDLVRKVKIHIPSMEEQLEFVAFAQQSDKSKFTGFKSQFIEMFGSRFETDRIKLSDISTTLIGLTYKPANKDDDGTLVLRSGNIQNSELSIKDDIVRVSGITISENKYIKPNDILMCARNGSASLVGKCCLIRKAPEEMTFGAFMTVIRSQYPNFLFGFFQTDYFKNQLTNVGTTSINQITSKMLSGYDVVMPTKHEEEIFGEFLKQSDKSK